jgi:hypothetical protein
MTRPSIPARIDDAEAFIFTALIVLLTARLDRVEARREAREGAAEVRRG